MTAFQPYNHDMPEVFTSAEVVEPRTVARLTVMGEPKAKDRPRAQPGGKGRSYTTPQTRAAEDVIRDAWNTLDLPDYPKGAKFRMDVVFYLGTKRHVDVDNLTKLVKDALNKVAYDDDNLVYVERSQKFHTTRDRARTEIVLSLIDPDREEAA